MRMNNYIKTLVIQFAILNSIPQKDASSNKLENDTNTTISNDESLPHANIQLIAQGNSSNTVTIYSSSKPTMSTRSRHWWYTFQACILILIIFGIGCKKIVEVSTPPTQILYHDVFENDASAMAAQSSVYVKLGSINSSDFSIYPGLSADEFKNYSTSPDAIQFYTNGLLSSNKVLFSNLWAPSYSYIYQVNAVLEGVDQSSALSNKVKSQLKGEALFTRAFLYFYLVNFFGDVPLILTTDYDYNRVAVRTTKSEIYKQMIKDLQASIELLNVDYVNVDGISKTSEKLRPNKAAANALLARVYLYNGDWNNAELQASAVVNSNVYSLATDLTKAFLKNSSEAIWQLSAGPAFNTTEGSRFIVTTTPQYVTLSTMLLNSFETNDKRLINWVSSFTNGNNTYVFPFKYRIKNSTTVSEYVMVLRYSEQYLIRAEASARQNKLAQAIADVNTIRSRAGLPNLSNTLTQDKVLTAIEQERRVELFSEWGDRWLNLKRTNRVDDVMTIAATSKGSSWQGTAQLYAIPQPDRSTDPNLGQNDGYARFIPRY